MRRVIACQYCRSRKTKCVHDGEAPCKTCRHNGKEASCVLGFPPEATGKKERPKVSKPRRKEKSPAPGFQVETPGLNETPSFNETPGFGINELESTHTDPTPIKNVPVTVTGAVPGTVSGTEGTIYDHIAVNFDEKTLHNIFFKVKKWFPELLFLHLPTLQFETYSVGSTLLNSIFALYSYFEEEGSKHPRLRDEGEYYDAVINHVLNPQAVLDTPSLENIQALTVLALLDWERENHYKSKMLNAIAINMLHHFDNSIKRAKDDPEILGRDIYFEEQCTRSFWSCFMINTIIESGDTTHSIFRTSNLYTLLLPLSEEEYLYINATNNKNREYITLGNFDSCGDLSSKNHSSLFLILLYEVWGKIITILKKGGRKTYRDPPWSKRSVFHSIKEKLFGIHKKLPENWKWSLEKLRIHTLRGTDNEYVMINSMYNLCFIYLTREYTPFFPHSNDKPIGPTEAPLLPSPPTADYWQQNSVLMFESTRNLISIIRASAFLEIGSGQINSPFFIYSVYTATITAFYGKYFHWMDPDNSKYLNDANNDFSITSIQMVDLLKEKAVRSPITKSWSNTALVVAELYSAVAEHRDTASELNLGRHTLSKLEDSIQITNTAHDHDSGKSLIEAISAVESPSRNYMSLDHDFASDLLLSGIDIHQKESLARILQEFMTHSEE